MAEQLFELLNLQASQLEKLLGLQTDERQALVQRDAPALEQVNSDKEGILLAIQETDQKIAAHPERDALSADPKLTVRMDEVQALMKKCQQQNEVNGQIVRVTLGRIQNLRQTIQAQQSGHAVTYTDKGKTTSGPSGPRTKA